MKLSTSTRYLLRDALYALQCAADEGAPTSQIRDEVWALLYPTEPAAPRVCLSKHQHERRHVS